MLKMVVFKSIILTYQTPVQDDGRRSVQPDSLYDEVRKKEKTAIVSVMLHFLLFPF